MGEYRNDRPWSDRFIPEIKRLIGPHLLEESSAEVDKNEAADLVLVAKDIRIACRMRRREYGDRYAGQFTIRSHRDSGARTELAKILEGWGDWLFYGFYSEKCAGDTTINPWYLVDLKVFRTSWVLFGDEIRSQEIHNGDGTYFRAFWIASFPSHLLIAHG